MTTKRRLTVKVKWVYSAAARADGCRILVDRMWPRALSKEAASLDDNAVALKGYLDKQTSSRR